MGKDTFKLSPAAKETLKDSQEEKEWPVLRQRNEVTEKLVNKCVEMAGAGHNLLAVSKIVGVPKSVLNRWLEQGRVLLEEQVLRELAGKKAWKKKPLLLEFYERFTTAEYETKTRLIGHIAAIAGGAKGKPEAAKFLLSKLYPDEWTEEKEESDKGGIVIHKLVVPQQAPTIDEWAKEHNVTPIKITDVEAKEE